MRINGIKNDVNQIKKWESKTKRKEKIQAITS